MAAMAGADDGCAYVFGGSSPAGASRLRARAALFIFREKETSQAISH
jgi:hypothetical protein